MRLFVQQWNWVPKQTLKNDIYSCFLGLARAAHHNIENPALSLVMRVFGQKIIYIFHRKSAHALNFAELSFLGRF